MAYRSVATGGATVGLCPIGASAGSPPSIQSRGMSNTGVKEAVEADEWRTAQSQFDTAAEIIKLEPWLREVLREVQRELDRKSVV